jgi:hypothetical protein
MCWAAAANLGWKGNDAAMQIRRIVVQYMRDHEAKFEAFVVGEDYQSYLRRIAVDREFLTEVELLAFAEAFGVCIELVYQDVDNPSRFYGNLENPRWVMCYEGNPTEDHRNVNHYSAVLPVRSPTTAERSEFPPPRPLSSPPCPPKQGRRRRREASPSTSSTSSSTPKRRRRRGRKEPPSEEQSQRRRQMQTASKRRQRENEDFRAMGK